MMRPKINHFAFACLVLAVAWWITRPVVAHAQTSNVLALEQRANLSVATPGDRLTFTLILTNTGTEALTGLIVTNATPSGSTFDGASAPRGWLMTTPPQNGSGTAIWHSTAALQPNERVELQLIVSVQNSSPIVSPGFSVTADQLAQPMISQSITIDVRPKVNVVIADPPLGWLAFIIVIIGLMIGAWRWRAVRSNQS